MLSYGDGAGRRQRGAKDGRDGSAGLFSLVGVVEIALGTSLISTNRYLVEHGVRTRGVVVANHRNVWKAGESPTYYPQVRYVGPGNHTYVVEGEGRPTPQFRVGDSATIYYDPQDPQTALVYAADTDSFAWVLIVSGGLLWLLVCPWPLVLRLLLRVRSRRSRARTRAAQ